MPLKKKTSVAELSRRESFNQKLVGYSATAGVALLMVPAAQAQTTFNITGFSTGGDLTFTSAVPSVTAPIGSGSDILAFKVRDSRSHIFSATLKEFRTTFRSNGTTVHKIHASIGAAAGKLIFANESNTVNRFVGGVRVVGTFGTAFANRGGELASRHVTHTSLGGNNSGGGGKFLPAGANGHKFGYIGFKTATGGYYGWLKVKVTDNASGDPTSITFVKGSDGLYGQIGDSSLLTDGTPATPIPEPADVASGLGLLALGAAGVREMRRRRAQAAV